MDAGTLYDAIVPVCPINGTSVGKSDDRSTWKFTAAAGASPSQLDAAQNVINTIPEDPLPTLGTDEFISRFTNAEYKALQQLRTTDNGKMAKDWDIVTSSSSINLNKQRTQTLKTNLVTAGILTQARADAIFV